HGPPARVRGLRREHLRLRHRLPEQRGGVATLERRVLRPGQPAHLGQDPSAPRGHPRLNARLSLTLASGQCGAPAGQRRSTVGAATSTAVLRTTRFEPSLDPRVRMTGISVAATRVKVRLSLMLKDHGRSSVDAARTGTIRQVATRKLLAPPRSTMYPSNSTKTARAMMPPMNITSIHWFWSEWESATGIWPSWYRPSHALAPSPYRGDVDRCCRARSQKYGLVVRDCGSRVRNGRTNPTTAATTRLSSANTIFQAGRMLRELATVTRPSASAG